MSMGELLASGLAAVFNPGMFFMVCLAIVLGTIFGALPGVSATMAVALGLTFTYTMEPIPAIVFLTAIYCSSITGGSITAILFKIPGVPSSAPTTFDGYPMAQRGEAGKAGIKDISQKNGLLRFILEDFDMARVSYIYAMPEFKGILKVEAGSKPCVSVKIKNKNRTIDEARKFVAAWCESKEKAGE